MTVALQQSYTGADSSLDHVFYQYRTDVFSTQCYEQESVRGTSASSSSFETVTIECNHHSGIALLELWIANDITKGVLGEGDAAVIPDCCHPDNVPRNTPVTKYVVEIKCVAVAEC